MASYYRCILCVGLITLLACNVIAGYEVDKIKDACKSAANPQFCITSLKKARGGPHADLTQLSVIALGLTAMEARRVSKLIAQLNDTHPNYHGIMDCVELFIGMASEIKKWKSELKGLKNGDFQKIILQVQNGLNDVGYNINDCYVKLKESGAAELIPIVVQYTGNLTMLTSDAQSVVSFLSQHGPS
ncbi:hypothetical protein SUGI_0221920 [Cryptomeria japonica]|nr:hypothetical protein SUGI_0221920 [Cryptomeria japonica]